MKLLIISSLINLFAIYKYFLAKEIYNTSRRIQSECAHLETQYTLLSEHLNKLPNFSVPIKKFLKIEYKYEELPTIYIVTPTDSSRVTQLAVLTRMRNTLWHVPKIFWIVVEDNFDKSEKVSKFLESSKIPHVHLLAQTPVEMKIKPSERHKPKGVIQRNQALAWIRQNLETNIDGVLYFADDDNSYDIRLFDEMRYTKVLSAWPIGYPATSLYEAPICKNNTIVSWFCSWECVNRVFPLDMASFAINIQVLLNNNIWFNQNSKGGFIEADFLKSFAKLRDFEPKANCTKVYVWNTKTFESGSRINKQFERLYDPNIVKNI